jgi:peptidoglycan hydrolase CwlO-like protein
MFFWRERDPGLRAKVSSDPEGGALDGFRGTVLPPMPVRSVPPTRRPLRVRLAAAALTCTVALSFAVGSSASTRSDLNSAAHQLSTLTEQIKVEEARATGLQDRLSELNAQMDAASRRETAIASDLVSAQQQIAELSSQEADLRAKVETMAQTLFMQGAGSMQGAFLGPLLSSTSMADFSDRLADAQAVGQADVDLAARLAAVKAGLTAQVDRLDTLQAEQAQVLSDLTQARATESQAIDAQRQALQDLDQTKDRIVGLILKLHRRQRAQELSAVGTAFQGPGHISYGAWAQQLMRTLGAPSCHSNLVVVVTWQYVEFTQATWNPLADSLAMPGSTTFNSSGVQNYPSLAVGLQAVKTTLENGASLGYGAIVSSLARCADAMTTARAINASAWCRGCTGGAYVTGSIAKVAANYSVYAKL